MGGVQLQVWAGPPVRQHPAAPSLLGRRKAASWPPVVLCSHLLEAPVLRVLCLPSSCCSKWTLNTRSAWEFIFGKFLGKAGNKATPFCCGYQTPSRLPQGSLPLTPLRVSLPLAAPDLWTWKIPSTWSPHSLMSPFCDLDPPQSPLPQSNSLYFYNLHFQYTAHPSPAALY